MIGALRPYALEARYELVKYLRLPMFAVPILIFPMMFYALFGLALGRGSVGDISVPAYLMVSYGAFGVIGCGLFSFGAGVASERGQGWMLLKRASPMPPGAYFFAKLFVAMTFSAVSVLLLCVIAAVFGGVRHDATVWAELAGILVAGVLPFCALGLAIGYFAGPNSAPAVVNLIYLPMAFLSGLFLPIDFLPGPVQAIAPALPAYHLAQLAHSTIGVPIQAPPWEHASALGAFTVGFLALAFWGYVRDEGKTFG
jgi:ABC-2 type transport system permease protein